MRGATWLAWLLLATFAARAQPPGPIEFVSTPPSAAIEGEPYTYTMQAVVRGGGDDDDDDDDDSGPGSPITYSALTLPNWLSFDGARTIAGTPGQADAGTHAVAVQASSGARSVTQTFQIEVAARNRAPILTSPIAPNPQDALAGEPYGFATGGFFADPDGDGLTFGASGLPASLSVNPASGAISGTPRDADADGSPFTVTVTASDGELSVNGSFTLRVTRPNRPPALDRPIAPDPQTATAGTAYRFAAGEFFSDPDGDSLRFSATGLPATLTIDASSGTITGTPTDADIAGSRFTVTVAAADATGSASDSFVLQIERADRPPELVRAIDPDPQNATEGVGYTFNVAPFFTDPDGDPLTFSASGLPPSLALDRATGQIGGTPTDADIETTPITTYTVRITAANDGGSATDSFVLRIENRNEAPTIPTPTPRLTTNEDTPLEITASRLGARDPDPGDELRVLLTPPKAGDSWSLAGGGRRVVPSADFNGTLTVEARVTDGDLESNTAQVTIDVIAVNDAPRGGPVPRQSATENLPFELELGTLFSDPEEEPLSFSAQGLPPGLTLDPVTGRLAGIPPLGTEAREYSVALTVSDGRDDLRTRFPIALTGADRTDLGVAVSVLPNPVQLDTPATLAFTVANVSAAVDVGNIDLEAELAAAVPIVFDASGAPACSLDSAANPARLTCRLGPLAAGAETSVTLGVRGSRAGDLAALARIAVADPVPIDANSANDMARAALQLTEGLGDGAAQTLAIADSYASAVGDLDGDGDADLAVAGAAGLSIHLAEADGANAAKRLLAAAPLPLDGTAANALALADLDGDGDLDIAVAHPAGVADTVWLNGGGLAFTAGPLGGNATDSRALAIADVDGDGLQDIVVAGAGSVAAYRNAGGGTFTTLAEIAGGDARALALADLLGDGLPEIVVAHGDGDASVYSIGAGTIALATRLPSGPATSVAAADFDGDGRADLVLGRNAADPAATPGNIVFLNQSGSGSPAFFPSAALGAAATLDVIAADVDLDGDADIVSINASGGHQLHVNNGNASAVFLLHPEQLVAPGARTAAAGKVSVDDRLDLVVAGANGVDVFLNDGQGGLGRGDEDAPTVTLIGEPSVAVTVGESYADRGATASDQVDGDLTARIAVDNPVDTAVVGSYTVTYRVTDNSGNAAAPALRTVEVRARNDTGGGGGGAAGAASLLLLAAAFAIARSRRRRP